MNLNGLLEICIALLMLLSVSCSSKFDASEYLVVAGDSVQQVDSSQEFVIKYYSDGNIKSEFTYLNGLLEGDIYDYYNVQDTVIRTNYPEIGDSYLWTKSRIKNYYYVEDGTPIFETNFSVDGDITNLDGNPIIYLLVSERDYKIYDTLMAEVVFVDLKEVNITASIIEFYNEDFMVLDTLKVDSQMKADLTYVFRKKGKVSLGIQYVIRHKDFYKKDEVVIPTFNVK